MHLADQRLGVVRLSPSGPVVAGTYGQWTFVYTVGDYGLDEGATIKLAQRSPSDWGVPQFDRPTEEGYTTVTTTGRAHLRCRYDTKAHERPWFKCLVFDVFDGYFEPGDTITVTLGDQSQGSVGIRAQSFQETEHEFRLLVDPTNACVARPLPSSPRVAVIAGEPVKLVVIVPTQAVVDEPVEVFVRGEDVWGNPTAVPQPLTLAWEGDAPARFVNGKLMATGAGTGQVLAAAGNRMARSNPLTFHVTPPKLQRYWGDLHAQTEATVGTGTEQEYFTFARDQARIDFASHQGNDFQMTDEDWDRLNRVVAQFHVDHGFVVFPGYEWSANTPAGGDRNVFYREEGMPIIRSSHWQVPQVPEDDVTPAHPADVFFQRLREKVDLNKVLVGSHVGGRYADIRRYFDPQLAPLVELVSCWGVFEWLLWDAFDAGHVVGVMCNSDGHKGRPGAEGPGAGKFGIGSGLTCALAVSLTRTAIFDALHQRRCYGTTGPRIDLDFQIDGQPMGSVVNVALASPPDRSLHLTATACCPEPIEAMILYRGREPVQVLRPAAFDQLGDSRYVRVAWRGARMRGRGRRVDWSGSLHAEDARILDVRTYAFDSAADGITHYDKTVVRFRSQTTGDTDGLILELDQATRGRLVLDTAAGRCDIDLARLPGDAEPRAFDLGGIDMGVRFQRYPDPGQLRDRVLHLETMVEPTLGRTTPWFVKILQCDGHMAWSSPIYLRANAAD